MFHRVKSELQNEDQKPQTEQVQEAGTEVEAKVTELQTPDMTLNIQTQSEDEASENTETTNSSTNEEEASEMSDAETLQEDTTTEAAMSPYQKSAPAPAATSYQSNYPGSSAFSSSPAPAASTSSSADRRLTIGAGITMSGEIEACDYLLVEGTVEAALKGANFLEVAESGTFYGTVEINEAVISGRFEGDITVNGRLTISASGTVTGSISYKELEIEAGAVVDGKLTPLSATVAQAQPAPKAAAKPAATKAAAQPKVAPAPANTDGELFSKAAASAE